MVSEFVVGFCGYIFFQSMDRKSYNYYQWGIRKLFCYRKRVILERMSKKCLNVFFVTKQEAPVFLLLNLLVLFPDLHSFMSGSELPVCVCS